MNASIRSKLDSHLRALSRKRKASTVTADDAHAFLDKTGKMSSNVKLSYINSILTPANDRVVPVGATRSKRPAAKGRTITEWTYVR